MTMMVDQSTVTGPRIRPPSGMTLGQFFCDEPFRNSPNHWKMKLMPTAVMSGASLGARRSRR